MLRTTAIALAAVATVGIASLASPAPAAAHGWKGHHHHHHFRHTFTSARSMTAASARCGSTRYYGGFLKRINVCY